MDRLELHNLCVGYGAKTVVDDLNLRLPDGEILSLLGPSGAGKSTVLKAVAGLLQPTAGRIMLNGVEVNRLPPEKRDAVLIFQKPLLFPFLTVGQNIAFGLRMTGKMGTAARQSIAGMLAITDLQGLEHRRVHQLSGGQQQRVALARGLVLEPSVLLLDEPFASLDAELREQMRDLIRTIQRQTATTMLFVTHDQSEAFAISNRVALLLGGRLRQIGTPETLFYQPADAEVASFFGSCNLLAGSVTDGRFCSGFCSLPTDHADCPQATAVIRPEDIELSDPSSTDRLVGTVVSVRFEGVTTRLVVKTGQRSFTVLAIRPQATIGDRVALRFAVTPVHVFSGMGEGDG